MISSDSPMSFSAIETPIPSIISSVSRIPAVSDRRSVISPSLTDSSTTSRVVPAMSVTMLLSQPLRQLKSVDFPTFGLPTIADAMP